MTTLLDRLPSLPANEWALRRDGDDWLLEAGSEHARLARQSRNSAPARIASRPAPRHLRPGPRCWRARPAGPRRPADPVLDRAGVASYQQRLSELGAELDARRTPQVTNSGLPAQSQNANGCLAELRRASGLGGRMRRTTSDSERARVNVTRTLRRALLIGSARRHRRQELI